jgi:predicted ATPase/DNA-binding CsgD family transcriptional regulator
VAVVVAGALGVREQPGVQTVEALTRVLARQQLLLVLDNCEHVIGAVAELCAGLLAACDDVTILATSREPLAVAGEARYRLAPLALPDPGDLAGVDTAEAVLLFMDRARSADAHFELTDEMAPAVARLVTRLDGMPLAIELAAARVEVLGVTQLLDRLDDRFALLASADRLAPSRQRSLAATVEWSYQLLDETGRRVFRALSVFQGPFTLAGAEAVAGDGAGPVVLRLVDCSLLVPPRAGADGRSRYSMLETLRAYGTRLLDQAGEREQAATALAGYAVAVADEAAAGFYSSAQEVAVGRWLDTEDALMRQVLAWGMARDTAVVLRLAEPLGWWWFLRGQLPGVCPLLLAAAGRAEPGSDGWCAARYWLGWAAIVCADMAGALDHFTSLRDAVAGRGPSPALADALGGRSAALRGLGRTEEAAQDASRALTVAQEVGNPVAELFALAGLSLAASDGADHENAVRWAWRAARVTDGVPGLIARTCNYYLVIVLAAAGDLAAAERVCVTGLARAREAGDLMSEAGLVPRLVHLDLRAGRIPDAAAHLREGLQLAVRTGNWTYLTAALYHCGQLCVATGRHAEALTVWAANQALAAQRGFTDPLWAGPRWEEELRKARQAAGAGQARAAEDRGAAMGWATAAEYALLLTENAGPARPTSAPGPDRLSARERELLVLVAQGRTNAQIAAELFISVRTVSTHLDRIRDKTGSRRRADLTRLALTAGLI